MDGTLEYRFGGRLQSDFAIPGLGPLGVADPFRSADRLRADLSSIVAMMNGYVDLGSYWGATPFVGAGIGIADNALSGVSDHGFALHRRRRGPSRRRIFLQRVENPVRLGA